MDQYSLSFETDEVLSRYNKGEDVVLSLYFGSERLLNERQQGIANITDVKGQDSQALYDQFSLEVTQPGLIGVGQIAQNALKSGRSNAEVESIVLKYNPTLQGIVADQGQERGQKAATIVIRGAQMRNLETEGPELEQGTQGLDQDKGPSL